jgi:hypothetical protein
MPNVFISYRRKDSGDVVGRLYDTLATRLPSGKVFRDLDTIPFGSSFPDVIDKAIAGADVVLVIIGPDWISQKEADGTRRIDQGSDPVRLEVETALAHGKPIVPILVRNAAFPREADLPASLQPLAKFNALPIRPDPDFHGDFQKLIGLLTETASEFLRQNQSKLTVEAGFLRVNVLETNHGGGFDAMQVLHETYHVREKSQNEWLSKLFKAVNTVYSYDQIDQKGSDILFPGGKVSVDVRGRLKGGEVFDYLEVSGEFAAASIWNTLSVIGKLGLPTRDVSECGLALAEGALSLKDVYKIVRGDGRFELLGADGTRVKARINADQLVFDFTYAKREGLGKDKMELAVATKDSGQLQSLFLLLAATVQASTVH